MLTHSIHMNAILRNDNRMKDSQIEYTNAFIGFLLAPCVCTEHLSVKFDIHILFLCDNFDDDDKKRESKKKTEVKVVIATVKIAHTTEFNEIVVKLHSLLIN